MGYRIFRDEDGTEWQTWDVVPRLSDRRVTERRARVGTPVNRERRKATDRRVSDGHRSVLSSALHAGWLCFEAQESKRRLTPIPVDWERCPNEKLAEYCTRARVVRRVAPLDIPKIDPLH